MIGLQASVDLKKLLQQVDHNFGQQTRCTGRLAAKTDNGMPGNACTLGPLFTVMKDSQLGARMPMRQKVWTHSFTVFAGAYLSEEG